MKRLKIALALDWDVLARIDQDGIEIIDLKPCLEILIIGLFHFCIYTVAASIISKNYAVMEYRFANGLYDFSFNSFLRLFW